MMDERNLSVAILFLSSFSCAADTFCADLEALARPGAVQALVLPIGLSTVMPLSERKGECRTSLALSGASHVHCSWSFGYRSDEAGRLFQGMIGTMVACLGPEVSMTSDRSVNHPDAYDLQMFDRSGQEFAVSIKDKGTLQRTLVFVRVQKN